MARIADRVYTEQHDIERLESTIKGLDIGHRVSFRMADGEVVQGIVAAKPTVQVFFDHAGREGLNAVVRLGEPAMYQPERAGWRDLWVDAIDEVRHHNPP